LANQKTWSGSQIICITLFSTGSLLAAFFSSLSKLREKPFSSQIIFITLFSTGSLLAAFLSSFSKLSKYVGEKPFS
jgi:hypothetical protein